jgi:hypothetical protein
MSESSRIWLIRHADRSFSRPLTETELRKRFAEGLMNPMDEICCSADYWFSVKDVAEIQKHFGEVNIEEFFKKSTEEITREHLGSTAKIIVPPKQMEEIRKQAAARPVPVSHDLPLKAVSTRNQIAGKLILFALTILIGLWFFLRMG